MAGSKTRIHKGTTLGVRIAWSLGLDSGGPVAGPAAVVGNSENMDYIISE